MKIFFKTQIRVILVFFTTLGLYAQTPGSLDTSFDAGTGTTVDFSGISTLALQADGKILVTGEYFTSYNGIQTRNIARLNTDGTFDTSFNSGTGFYAPGNGYASAMIVQPDGKIIVAGSFTSYNSQSQNKIVRLHSNGDIDTSFNVGTGFITTSYGTINALALQADGKILVGGSFISYNGQQANSIIRLNTDGSVDTSFNIGTGVGYSYSLTNTGYIYDIEIQPDEKIIIGGRFNLYNEQSITGSMARLNSDGSLDTSFDVNTGIVINAHVRSIALQSDGKIVVGDSLSENQVNLIRLNTDGSLDADFDIGLGFSGVGINSIEKVIIQPDGKIIAGGEFSSLNGQDLRRITRFNSDGTIDETFDIGSGFDNSITDVLLQPDGKVIVGGWFSFYDGQGQQRIVRLNSDGSKDNFFDIGTSFRLENTSNSARPNSLAIQPDGKIITVGQFSDYNEQPAISIVRLNPDGSIDTSFQTGTGLRAGVINAVADVKKVVLQPDGKILICGNFHTYNGLEARGIARLNVDGSLETIFDTPPFSIHTFDIQPDGKIVVGSDFSPYIARYNVDGSLDTSFNVGSSFNGKVYTIVSQPDGKIVVGGNFTQFNGQTQNRISRLNPDGSLDSTFNQGGTGIGNHSQYMTIAIQPNGKILVGGSQISSYNGQTISGYKGLIRLNTDGSLDTSFEMAGSGTRAIILLPDDKILIGGSVSFANNGISQRGIARLNSDGSLDSSFQAGLGFNVQTSGYPYALALQPDGKIVVGGSFTQFNGINKNKIVRLHGDSSSGIEDLNALRLRVYPNPTTDYFNIISESIIQSIELYDVSGRLVRTSLVHDFETQQNITNLNNGVYILKIKTNQGAITGKIVKK